MAQHKINKSSLSLLCLIAAVWLLAGAGCASVQASAANTAALNTAPTAAEQHPTAFVTITSLVLPSQTPSSTATAAPSLTLTLPPTETPTPTITPTATPTAALIPPHASLNYISLSRLDALERLAALKSDTGETGGFAFSPDARWLATAAGASINLWDLNAGVLASELSIEGTAHFTGPVAFHPNSRRLAAVDERGQVHAWVLSAEGGQPAPGPNFVPAEVDHIIQIAFNTNGSRLIGLGERNGQGVLILWETSTGNRLVQKPTGSSSSGSLLISPNGAWIVHAGQEGVLRFWSPATGQSLGQQIIYACPDSLLGAAFSPNGAILALQCDGETNQIFLDAPNYFSPGDRSLAGILGGSDPGPGLLSFNRDGGVLAAAAGDPSRQVQLWNLIDMYSSQSLAGFEDNIRQLAFSPDGKWLAIRMANGTLELWGIRK